MRFADARAYRRDIDGLRAIAVLAVIIFHFGAMPKGYLGVDVFFVVSGYLITGIIYKELAEGRFSILGFYLRRTRRILPLSMFVVLVSLAVGLVVMLPDDLENLAESVVATNLFSNNILQAITTKNYWDVVNDVKPLMHTWSLGVEEQYYLLYPVLLLLVGKYHRTWLLPMLAVLTVLSLSLYFMPFFESHEKFYYIPFRFFELSLGGIAAIWLNGRLLIHRYSPLLLVGLIVSLCVDVNFIPNQWLVLLTVLLTLGVLISANEYSKASSFLLENRIAVGIGLISYSLYMWHQVILAYARYFVVQIPHLVDLVCIFILTVLLSALTYLTIEKPFRDKRKVATRTVLMAVSLVFLSTTLGGLYVYSKSGIIRDVPELGLSKSSAKRGVHSEYNMRVYKHDTSFGNDPSRVKVLVIGDSFARDWVNVLLESPYNQEMDISYVSNPFKHADFQSRAMNADVIFYSMANRDDVQQLGIDETKLFVVGTKNFGINTGYFYNHKGPNRFSQRTLLQDGILESNERLKREWGTKYIDLIGKVIGKDNTVPVFTPTNMFISQDCRHLTRAGALYFVGLLKGDLASILADVRKRTQGHPA